MYHIEWIVLWSYLPGTMITLYIPPRYTKLQKALSIGYTEMWIFTNLYDPFQIDY